VRQNEEEDPHWREQQFSYEERRSGRRINEDQYEERRSGSRISIEEEDQYWSDQQNHQERRRYGRNFDENHWERGQQPRPTRLDFPMFDGENPTSWIYKVEQFFEHYHTLERQKLKLAEVHMEGEALNWFRKSEECGYFHNWMGFTDALLLQFDPMETLTRLRQTSTVTLYKIQFEVLSNRLKNLSEEYKLSCFLNGLKDDIRLPLRLLSPQNLNNAFTMAKIQEGGVLNFRRTSKFSTYTNSNWQNSKGVMDGDAKLEGGSRTQTDVASDPQVELVEVEISEHKNQSTFEKDNLAILENVASDPQLESIEEEIQEIKIEDMESRNQKRRMAGVFKETPLIFENAVTLVNHRLFDQSPQPNQVKLSKSEPIFVKILEIRRDMFCEYDGWVFKTKWKIKKLQEAEVQFLSLFVFQFLTTNDVHVVVFKHRWRWKYRCKLLNAKAGGHWSIPEEALLVPSVWELCQWVEERSQNQRVVSGTKKDFARVSDMHIRTLVF